MPKPSELVVTASKADASGKRLVVVMFGNRQHRDTFDPDAGYQRRQWREAVIRSLRVEPEIYNATGSAESTEAHLFNAIDDRLYAAIEAADAEPAGSLWQPGLRTMADVQEESTEWIWDGYLPAGAISVIDGDPGLGKSQLTIDLAARISRGSCMPPHSGFPVQEPRGVLMCNVEDDPSRTIRPRLQAAGADLKRVHILQEMVALGGEEKRPVSLPLDLPAIEDLVQRHNIAMVVLDPFVAFMDPKLSANNDADVRQVLGQVATSAQRTGASWTIIRHLNKRPGVAAIYRGGGSIGIVGAARAGFVVGTDPADETQRIFAQVKGNLAPPAPSLRFSIETVGKTSRISWGEHCEVSASDLCEPSKERTGGKCDAAKDILRDILGGGSRGSNEVETAMDEAGISKSTYWRARRELGVTAEKTEYQGQWLLSLPVNGFQHEDF